MRFLPELFANNRAWSEDQRRMDPDFFERLCAIQQPGYLWIGCADSRVPANTIVGLAPGQVFVHRNVANIARADDPNCLAVLQFAVDVLKVPHVIVCGHYRCGGVLAALGPDVDDPLQGWLQPIRDLHSRRRVDLEACHGDDARWDRLCELNVIDQVNRLKTLPTVTGAWLRRQTLAIHGWIYDLRNGLLRDLEVSVDRPA